MTAATEAAWVEALIAVGRERDAIEQLDDSPSALRAKALWNAGHPDEALAEVSLLPDEAYSRAWMLAELGSTEEAAALLHQSEPTEGQSEEWLSLGLDLAVAIDDPASIRRYAEQLSGSRGDEMFVDDVLAYAAERQGRWADAIHHYRRAAERVENNWRALYRLSVVAEYAGAHDLSLEAAADATRNETSGKTAAERLRYVVDRRWRWKMTALLIVTGFLSELSLARPQTYVAIVPVMGAALFLGIRLALSNRRRPLSESVRSAYRKCRPLAVAIIMTAYVVFLASIAGAVIADFVLSLWQPPTRNDKEIMLLELMLVLPLLFVWLKQYRRGAESRELPRPKL